jgi:hypothetical protein
MVMAPDGMSIAIAAVVPTTLERRWWFEINQMETAGAYPTAIGGAFVARLRRCFRRLAIIQG